MKIPLKMGIRFFIMTLFLMVLYILSYGIIITAFSIGRDLSPILGYVEIRAFRSFLLFLLAALIILTFLTMFILPVIHIISWIQELSKGVYQEPNPMASLAGRKTIYSICITYLYKEVLMQMQILTDRLKETEAAQTALEQNRRQWLSGITHDLKTPLSYLQGYASMIAAEQYHWSESQIKDFGKKMEEKSMHIKTLIDDLNLSFQSDSGKITAQKTKTELVEFLQNLVLDTANSPRCTDYLFSYEPDISSAYLNADHILLQRAFQNILMNAVIHNPPQTEITVSLKRLSDAFLITISDNGNGMDRETQKNLFESYYRGLPTDLPTEGSGLGMAIAKQFIELHSGRIKVESKSGQGTSIAIELPVL